MKKTYLSLLILSLLSTPLFAEQSDDLDALMDNFDDPAQESQDHSVDVLMDGFDDTPSSVEESIDALMGGFDEGLNSDQSITTASENSPLSLTGSISIKGEYAYAHKAPATGATDYRGLTHLKTRIGLKADYDINDQWRAHIDGSSVYDLGFRLNGRDEYPQSVLDGEEQYGEIGEAWVRGTLTNSLDLKIGRQIVIWGKSDSLRVTDVINPLDNRFPGMSDIEDLRLPVTMAKLDYYVGDWGISAMLIPEFRAMRLPADGSEFDPFPGPLPAESKPDNTEYAFAINGMFSGWDLSLYWANVYDDIPHVSNMSTPSMQRSYSRYTMMGTAANMVTGSWLLKGEIARFDGLRFNGSTNPDYKRTSLLAGAEYNGITDSTIALEITYSKIHDYQAILANVGVDETSKQVALRYTADFMHNQLHITAMASGGVEEGGFSRVSGQYDLADAMSMTTGVVMFHSGSMFPIGGYGENDRLFVEYKYSF